MGGTDIVHVMSTKIIPCETADLRLGTPATLTGVTLELTGIDIGRDADVRVELRLDFGTHLTNCTLKPREVLNLHDGTRLTVSSVENVYSDRPLVHMMLERLIPFPDPWSPTTPQMVVDQLWEQAIGFNPLGADNQTEFRAQIRLVGDTIRHLEHPDVPGSMASLEPTIRGEAVLILDVYGIAARLHFPDLTWLTSNVSAVGVAQAYAIATALLAHRGAQARTYGSWLAGV